MLLQTSDVQIKKISQKNNVGVFEFAPLPSGFGRTLGNGLRRILLSSLTGAAVTQVKFPKVNHQFSTIPGVKEDVVELCLNFKEVVVKIHGDGPVVGKISKKGKGEVTAGDIELSSDAEVINKDLHIADLADAKSSLEVEITVEPGVGYSPTEERKTSKVGTILIDAVYSPVINVSYEVEATRKGEEMGLDKLILTVQTNGSIDAEDAVVESATLLRNFFSRFARGIDPEEVRAEEESTADVSDVSSKMTGKDDVLVEDLGFPTRTLNALKKANINSLNQLAKLSPDELADIKNLGEKSVLEIKKLLKKEGLNSAA